jgi:hypothetical protein
VSYTNFTQNVIRWCGSFSSETFLHIGFTGTELCVDPVNNVATVILANGRHPYFNSTGMIRWRPQINDGLYNLWVQSSTHAPGSSSPGAPPDSTQRTTIGIIVAASLCVVVIASVALVQWRKKKHASEQSLLEGGEVNYRNMN